MYEETASGSHFSLSRNLLGWWKGLWRYEIYSRWICQIAGCTNCMKPFRDWKPLNEPKRFSKFGKNVWVWRTWSIYAVSLGNGACCPWQHMVIWTLKLCDQISLVPHSTENRRIHVCFGSPYYALWLVKSYPRHFLDQSEVKPKPIVTYSHAFSRTWRQLLALPSTSDWCTVFFSPGVIGWSNTFGFGFTILIENRSITFKFLSR